MLPVWLVKYFINIQYERPSERERERKRERDCV